MIRSVISFSMLEAIKPITFMAVAIWILNNALTVRITIEVGKAIKFESILSPLPVDKSIAEYSFNDT